jgi:hypothetical protein
MRELVMVSRIMGRCRQSAPASGSIVSVTPRAIGLSLLFGFSN